MPFPRPGAELIARMKAALPPEATLRPMFGQVAFFLNGNLAGGSWGDQVMVRLTPEDMLDAEDQGATLFDPMGDRPMKEYRLLPAAQVADAQGMRQWVQRALRATARLPPKEKKEKVKKKTEKRSDPG